MASYEITKEGITLKVEGAVATLINDRPEFKNGLDWKAKEFQAECYRKIAAEPDLRVLVFKGTGEYFWTGGRVDASRPGEKELYAKAIEHVEEARQLMDLPIIAAVNGKCFKGGIGIVAQADMAVAKKSATFSFPEVRMGGVPMVVMARCMRYLPKKLALEAYYSSEEFPAQRFYECGLLNAVCEDEEFDEVIDRYVHKIIDYPESLINMTRKAYYAMEAIADDAERVAFSQKMLAEEVLVQMTKEKTVYNP